MNSMYNDYAFNTAGDIFTYATDSEMTFRNKYIHPIINENSKEGNDMQNFFNNDLFDSHKQDFQNGFKVYARNYK